MKTLVLAGLLGATSAMTADALAVPLKVGEQMLQIPLPPETDTTLSESQPELLQVSQAYLGENHLIEMYARQAEVAHMQEDGLQIYCQLQVHRRLEHKSVALGEFAQQQAEIEKGLTLALSGDGLATTLRETQDKGNSELQRTSGSNASLAFDKPRYHGVYAREPWGLFYSMEVPVTLQAKGKATSTLQAAAGAFVDAGGKLISLNCYRELREAQDMDRVRAQTRAWGDAVSAANPAPRGESHALGGADWGKIMRQALVGGALSGIIGLVAALVLWLRQRR